MQPKDSEPARWLVVVRLLYGPGLGSFWECSLIVHSMTLKLFVRATSFIFLLGVGSFLCYKLYNRLRRLSLKPDSDETGQIFPEACMVSEEFLKSLIDFEYMKVHDDSSGQSLSGITGESLSFDFYNPSLSFGIQRCQIPEFFASLSANNSPSFANLKRSRSFPENRKLRPQAESECLINLGQNYEKQKQPYFRTFDNYNEQNLFPKQGNEQQYGYWEKIDPDGQYLFSFTSLCSDIADDQDTLSQCDSLSYDGSVFSSENSSPRESFSFETDRQSGVSNHSGRFGMQLQNKGKTNTSQLALSLLFTDSEVQDIREVFSGHSCNSFLQKLMRELSVDSDLSEFNFSHNSSIEGIGSNTVSKLDNLQSEVIGVKQEVLDLDADLVNLKLCNLIDKNNWKLISVSDSELSEFSQSESNTSGLLDVVNLHKTKVWYKGLLKSFSSADGSMDATYSQYHSNPHSPCEHNFPTSTLPHSLSFPYVMKPHQNMLKDSHNSAEYLETSSSELEIVDGEKIKRSLSLQINSEYLAQDNDFLCSQSSGIPKSVLQNDANSKFQQNNSSFETAEDSSCNHMSLVKKIKLSRTLSSPTGLLTKQILLAIKKTQTPDHKMHRSITVHSFDSCVLEKFSPVSKAPSLSQLSITDKTDSGAGLQLMAQSLPSSDESGFHECHNLLVNRLEELSPGSYTPESMTPSDSTYSSEQKNINNFDIVNQINEVDDLDNNGNHFEVGDVEYTSQSTESTAQQSLICDSADSYFDIVGKLQDIGRYLVQQCNINTNLGTYTKTWKVQSDANAVIRATIFQVLSSRLPILQLYGGSSVLSQKLKNLLEGPCPWLQEWRCSWESSSSAIKNRFDVLKNCLQTLEKLEEELKTSNDREKYLLAAMNNSQTDMKLVEAVKLLMTISAIKLYEKYLNQDVVPLFVSLLFNRNATQNPHDLAIKHLNLVGISRSLEQIDLYLLGYSLSVTLTIIHPLHQNSEECTCHYPECMIGLWPEIVIMSEDDYHYSVLIH